MGFFAAILFAAPIVAPIDYFDEQGLPPVQIEDLDRFHDPILALHHGATAAAVEALITDLESRWWDTAGFEHEYQQDLRRLRWVRECWLRLQLAADEDYGEECRLENLTQLRRLLGPTLYLSGRMPDYPAAALSSKFQVPSFEP